MLLAGSSPGPVSAFPVLAAVAEFVLSSLAHGDGDERGASCPTSYSRN